MVEKIKILLINGSERVGGNSELLANAIIDKYSLSEGVAFKLINLREYDILPCGQCGDCNYRKEPCSQVSSLNSIIEYMIDSDALIYIAPVHGFGLAHLMQIFIERAGVCHLRFTRPLANKVAGAIVVGHRYGHGPVHSQLINNFLLNQMIVAGSGYPALINAAEVGDVFKDTKGLRAVSSLMDRAISLTKCLSYVKESQINKLPSRLDNERSYKGKFDE